MNVQLLDRLQFQSIHSIRRVIVHDNPQKFASIAVGQLSPVGISWRSELVEPIVVCTMDDSIAWLGVDQQVVALDLNADRVAIALSLSSNLVQIVTAPLFTVILTELDIFIFNADRSMRCFKGLPDVAIQLSLEGSTAIVQLVDGNSIAVNIETGVIKESILVS
jgi:hypothetical protein